MKWNRSQPLLPSNHSRSSHQSIIYQMCKMISRQSISFDQDNIIIVVYHIDLSSEQVRKGNFFARISMTPQPQNRESLPLFLKFLQKFIWTCISPLRILPIDSWNELICGLHFSDFIEFFLGHSAWICKSLSHQMFGKHTIKMTSLRLSIRTIGSDFCLIFSYCPLIKTNPKPL